MNGRIVRILEIFESCKHIKVTLLAELLDVSQVTLRRDLDKLEKRGIICRSHGYASLDGADITSKRMAFCYSIKQRIARAAALTVEEGETVMLDSGSCCALFAEELALTKKNITIITNSAYIAYYVSKLPNLKIILLGGYFQPESQMLIGPMTIKSAENFYTDKFFLSADGFIPGLAFTGRDHLCVETALGLANYTKEIFVLTEAAKFRRRGAYILIKLDKLAGVFTDDNIPKEAEKALVENNVFVHKVPAVEEKLRWCQFSGMPPILYTEK